MIIVEPFGGLANRMRAIASTLYISEITNHKIELIWPVAPSLNCFFNDLFYPIENVVIKNDKNIYRYAKSTNHENRSRRVLHSAINKLIGIDYCIKNIDFRNYIWTNKIDLLDVFADHNNIYLNTDNEFYGDKSITYYNLFRPIDKLQLIINNVSQLFIEDTIGLHIRRTDNKKAIKHSPTYLFIDTINKELSNNPKANFFLATDDLNTELELKNLFKGKIITYNKEFNRRSTKGIEDAIVDLYCLSKTKYIYGSHWSSFSRAASRLGNIKLTALKTDS